MIIEESGMFVTQRSDRGLGIGIKSVCLIRTSLKSGCLVLNAPDMPEIEVPLYNTHSGTTSYRMEVQIWEDRLFALDLGEAIAEWITEFLSRERKSHYRIVKMPSDVERKTKLGEGKVMFADGYPILIASTESLDDLNSRMVEALPMNRFRPNIVLSGCLPYEEDTFVDLRIGDTLLRGVKLCVRCPVPTTDQLTAERGKEPLKTLATYRKSPKGVVFAKNFNVVKGGTILVGDAVTVISREEDPQF
jgi:uncharacterized protein YcbX